MSGFENFWNFKTMLDLGKSAFDEEESKSEFDSRIGVPFLASVQLSLTEFDQPNETVALVPSGVNFDDALQNLAQLTRAELHELRRKIALHSHPDLKHREGFANNGDLMSTANGLIDDEIKRRLGDDPRP